MVLGLALMGSGLIVLGFVVLLGIDAIKAIADRGQSFILGGSALILAGVVTLASILFATGRVKIPKLVLRFEDRDEDEDDDDSEDDSDDDSDEDSDDDEEVGKAPKEEDDEKKD